METTASGEIETLIESLGLHSSLRSLVGFRLFVCLCEKSRTSCCLLWTTENKELSS